MNLISSGISMKAEEFEADLFKQSLQMNTELGTRQIYGVNHQCISLVMKI